MAERPLNRVTTIAAEKVRDDYAETASEEFYMFLESFAEQGSVLEPGMLDTETSMIKFTSDVSTNPKRGNLVYVQQLNSMRHDNSQTLYVDFNHVLKANETLATAIMNNYYRFVPYLEKAVYMFVKRHMPEYVFVGGGNVSKEFSVAFKNLNVHMRIREMTTKRIGMLMKTSGTITRTSEVKPELNKATFQCVLCGGIVREVVQQFKYTEPQKCVNPICMNKKEWRLLIEQSVFMNWQKIHIQENSNEIPAGSMPRGMDVIIRNDMVERAKPGDKCDFIGTMIVVPDVSVMSLPGGKIEKSREGGRSKEGYGEGISGLKSLGVREMSYKLVFVACYIEMSEQKGMRMEEGEIIEFTAKEKSEILNMKETPQLYQKIVESIAPTIYGHKELKSGVALMLFGGVNKVTNEGIRLRGDINICIVGDPGVAKSQILKYVTGFIPRSVFTSGKASSAAGLTASVVKDEETGEFTIEAGALMLADNGICAIDEFDKMDLSDQVAIHEAMEQQTITISKAGIQATLNARTSILAAANPIHGRYDKKKSLRQNIAMTAPIMSRFDLFFVVLDDCDEETDYSIARHIINLHKHKDEAIEPYFSTDQLKRYIRYAKTIKPQLTIESSKLLVSKYKEMRQNDASSFNSSYRMTVRQLESIIRLSEALAKLFCDHQIKPKYVKEACRLLKNSIIKVESEDISIQVADESNELEIENQEISETISEKSQTFISYDEYIKISQLLIFHIKKSEETGIKKSQVIDWFLEQSEDEIHSEQDLIDLTKKVKGIIERLIHKDSVLIEFKSDDDSQDYPLVVHPNYSIQ